MNEESEPFGGCDLLEPDHDSKANVELELKRVVKREDHDPLQESAVSTSIVRIVKKTQMYIEPSGYLSKTVTLDEERARKPGHAFQSQPSSSTAITDGNEDRGTGSRALTQLTLRIGKKQLTFKVKDAPPPSQEYPPGGSGDWDWDNRASLHLAETTVRCPQKQLHRCNHCDRAFKSIEEIRHHVSEAHAFRPFSCNSCQRSFAAKNELVIHMRGHEHDRPYQCDFCSKRFRHRTNLNQHLKLHASGRRHFCSVCGKCTKSAQDLTKHQVRCLALHEQNDRVGGGGSVIGAGMRDADGRLLKHECAYCGKPFPYNRDKVIHERVHTGEKPYECGYCGRGFTQSQACESHIRTHTGEKPYKCPHPNCGKSFRDSSAFRKHEANHYPSILRRMSGGRVKMEVREDSYAEDEEVEEEERGGARRAYRDGPRSHLMSSQMEMEEEEGELEEEVEEEIVEEGEIPMDDDEGYYM